MTIYQAGRKAFLMFVPFKKRLPTYLPNLKKLYTNWIRLT